MLKEEVPLSLLTWIWLQWYLESQIDLALGEDVVWKFWYRRNRTPDGGWWDTRVGHIPWERRPSNELY
jgi:hypothetical protein